jgi:hypothetical protein
MQINEEQVFYSAFRIILRQHKNYLLPDVIAIIHDEIVVVQSTCTKLV